MREIRLRQAKQQDSDLKPKLATKDYDENSLILLNVLESSSVGTIEVSD